MALSWCKVASNLDSHPKIRKAGRLGREVFLFALRRNAEPGNPIPGRLPKDELEPWYIADQLQMPVTDAVTGVTAAVTAGLLAEEGHSYIICSWKDGWGKDNGSGAERTARWRENKKLSTRDNTGDGRDVTNVTRDGRDIEEKRREETKEEGSLSVPHDGLDELKKKTDKAVADKAAKIPDRAWKAADYLRDLVLEEDPSAAVGRVPWGDTVQSGVRLGWADDIRLMVVRDKRTYEQIAETLRFLFREQTGGARFIVQSTESLRKKWDNIQAVRRNAKPEHTAPRPRQIPIAGSDRR
jgi:hypothetical protein